MRLHVLYERDGSGKAHGCAWIRLLHPLSHPSIASRVSFTTDERLPEAGDVDALIVERLHRPNLTLIEAEKLISKAKERRIPLIHTVDDNLLDLNTEPGIWHFPSQEQRNVLRLLIRRAQGVIVSTEKLAERVRHLNARVEVVPNQIDERLFTRRPAAQEKPGEKVVIGYMGTPTHLDDLLMILQPLRRFLARFKDQVAFEVVGVADAHFLKEMFPGLPVRQLPVPRKSAPYPEFARWMDTHVKWDFAVAPLADNEFTSCKSDLKILDYGILGIPGIFSDVPSYRSTVKHGENGLLVENVGDAWEAALEKMTLNNAMRRRLAAAVAEEVWNTRTLAQNAVRWEEAVIRLKETSSPKFIEVL